MKCYYEVLELDRTANESEIKTAYRKLALKWHPDKNSDNVDFAKEQFQLIQQAYEVLSDRIERAWYDKHRDQILHKFDISFQNNTFDIFPYFTSQCFKGYNDNDCGFYTIYRNVFDKIIEDELPFIEDSDTNAINKQFPTFGTSTSNYEEIVKPFYDYWTGFSTFKTYVWLNEHDVRDVRNRKIFKLMEKDNQKIRSKARKERNEQIHNLVLFVRKRDRRVQIFIEQQKQKNEENRRKVEQIRVQRKLERLKQIEEATTVEWAQFSDMENELNNIEKNCCDSDDMIDTEDSLLCTICSKLFQNINQFRNHVASKKHLKNQELMTRKIVQEENEYMSKDINAVNEEEPNSNKKKKNPKRSKKILKVDEDNSSDDEEIPNNFLPQTKTQLKNQLKKELSMQNKPIKNYKNDDNHERKCAKCNEIFASKNKLFDHLQTTGHSVYLEKNDKSRSKKSNK